MPWRREWQPTPVLLPGKSHGQRSLVGYSPWGRKELDTMSDFHFTHLFLLLLHQLHLRSLGIRSQRLGAPVLSHSCNSLSLSLPFRRSWWGSTFSPVRKSPPVIGIRLSQYCLLRRPAAHTVQPTYFTQNLSTRPEPGTAGQRGAQGRLAELN